jgi:hypothetical protein
LGYVALYCENVILTFNDVTTLVVGLALSSRAVSRDFVSTLRGLTSRTHRRVSHVLSNVDPRLLFTLFGMLFRRRDHLRRHVRRRVAGVLSHVIPMLVLAEIRLSMLGSVRSTSFCYHPEAHRRFIRVPVSASYRRFGARRLFVSVVSYVVMRLLWIRNISASGRHASERSLLYVRKCNRIV